MKLIRTAVVSAAAATALQLTAQQPLNKEIIVEREVDPVERAATRPAISPAIVAPRIAMRRLEPGEYTANGRLRHMMPVLEAAAWNDTLYVSPYRGYAAVGYLPAFNLAASAGYDFYKTRNHTAGIWLQYDGDSYRQSVERLAGYSNYAPEDSKVTNRQNTFKIGIDGDFGFKAGNLAVSVSGMMSARRLPNIAPDYDQTAWSFGLDAAWKGEIGAKNKYNVGVNVGSFGFDKNAPEIKMSEFLSTGENEKLACKALNEVVYGFDAGYERLWRRHSWGADVNAEFQHLNGTGTFYPHMLQVYSPEATSPAEVPATVYWRGDGDTRGFLRLKPYYRLKTSNLTMHIGLNIPFGFGNDKDTYIMPDVHVSFAPSGRFALWAEYTGDVDLNTLGDMYQINPYLLGNVSYRHTSHAQARLGLTFGPFTGFTAEVWGGIANANDWYGNAIVYGGNTVNKDLVPGTQDFGLTPGFDIMETRDCDGVFGGIRLGYQYRDVVKVSASAELASHDQGDGGYYMWRDRAKSVIGANLVVKPIPALEVGIDWELRLDRVANAYYTTEANFSDIYSYTYWNARPFDLGDVNMLKLSASYRLTDAFTVFATLDNLLCKRWNLTPQVLANGHIHGLVGVSLRF